MLLTNSKPIMSYFSLKTIAINYTEKDIRTLENTIFLHLTFRYCIKILKPAKCHTNTVCIEKLFHI